MEKRFLSTQGVDKPVDAREPGHHDGPGLSLLRWLPLPSPLTGEEPTILYTATSLRCCFGEIFLVTLPLAFAAGLSLVLEGSTVAFLAARS